MKVEQLIIHQHGDVEQGLAPRELVSASVVLGFGAPDFLREARTFELLRAAYPRAILLGCSTAGEIRNTEVHDGSLCVTAVQLDRTRARLASVSVQTVAQSRDAGRRLGTELFDPDLSHVFVISDGLRVNGTDLVAGLRAVVPDHIGITGGLAGDGGRFKETWVMANAVPENGKVAALGFYGTSLRTGYASLGGWDPFGPERIITRASGNVLYELDNQSALHLYKQYLGEQAKGLPATGLLFPLRIKTDSRESGRVRTILAVDEAQQSMTFAGDMPVGAQAQFMMANFDRLIDGAIGAADVCRQTLEGSSAQLAILISCVGRKLVLKQRVEEEVEGVREVLGNRPVMAGFYSYGEISPQTPQAKCELHNQTMTITTLSEV